MVNLCLVLIQILIHLSLQDLRLARELSCRAQWASYQIRSIASCACVGNTGNVFPAIDFNGFRHASRHMCHPRVVMRVGIADPRWWANVTDIPGACATRNFAKRLIVPWFDGQELSGNKMSFPLNLNDMRKLLAKLAPGSVSILRFRSKKSCCGDKTVAISSYFHNRNPIAIQRYPHNESASCPSLSISAKDILSQSINCDATACNGFTYR